MPKVRKVTANCELLQVIKMTKLLKVENLYTSIH